MDRIIGEKFKLGRKIGSGSFGEIYLGLSLSRSIIIQLDYFIIIIIIALYFRALKIFDSIRFCSNSY